MAKISLKSCRRLYKNCTPWQKALLICIIVLIITYIFKPKNALREGLNESSSYTIYENDELYDSLYCSVYDDLVKSDLKNVFEIEIIKNNAGLGKNSLVLDIGSGTGHHVKLLSKTASSVIGVDKSPYMIKEAKKLHPNLDFREGDVMNSMIFADNVFSHITCFYFTIYYFKDKKLFFQNCYKWLSPGGTLIVHLVDKFNFDPIVGAGDPFIKISPQKYADKRITNTTVAFDKFKYSSDFKLGDGDEAIFEEKFKFKNSPKQTRVNQHKLIMPKQTQIISMAKNAGFIMLSKIEMKDCSWDNQYLYILQKPN